MKKRIWAYLLMLVMVVGLLPATALAENSTPLEQNRDQGYVSTEEELKQAIEDATGTEEEPTEIYVNGSIEISNSIDIGNAKEAKNIKIIGSTDDAEIVFSDSPAITYSSMLKVMYGTVELSNITLDANQKSRVLYVDGNGAAELVISYGTVIQNGYLTGNASGAAVMAYGTVIMNGGLIQDCCSEYYGGAICVDNSGGRTFIMNDGKIDSCYSNNMGGAIHARKGALYLNGGTISNCYSVSGRYNNGKAAVWGQNNSDIYLRGSFVFNHNQNGDIAFPVDYDANYYITSALKNEIVLEGFDKTPKDTQLLKSSENYTLTDEDFAKVTLTNCDYALYHNQGTNSFDVAIKSVITFNANDGSAEPATVTQDVPKGIETTLKENTFERNGYKFTGWNTEKGGNGTNYANGAKVTFDADATLYAQWVEKTDTAVTIAADRDSIRGKGTVTLKVTAEPEDILGKVTVSCNGGIPVTENADGTYSAYLPNKTQTYTFTAEYAGDDTYIASSDTCAVSVKKKSSSSGSSSGTASTEKTYTVSKADSMENGKVTVDLSKAEKGDKVTFTVTPDKGYEINKVTVKDADGNKIEVKEKGEGKYTFTMPDSKVEIKATFSKVEETPVVAEEAKPIILTLNQRVASVFGEPVVNDVAPVIKNDRTMLPIRFVAEALGGVVAWDDVQNKVTITKDELTIEIYIGQSFALVNGNPIELDAPAFIESGRTYLPLRFVAENLGATVTWDAATQQVTIIPQK